LSREEDEKGGSEGSREWSGGMTLFVLKTDLLQLLLLLFFGLLTVDMDKHFR